LTGPSGVTVGSVDRRLLRPGALVGHLLVLVAVLVCLRLGWWQYERAHEATGTAQNWGYALLWPCFAVAFVYMWVKFLRLEHDRDVDDEAAFDDGLAQILDDPGRGDGGRPAAAATTGAPAEDDTPEPEETGAVEPPTVKAGPPSRSVIISVATVGDDDEDDPELAAYNRALAELAERDRNGAS
jgi:hypothetical protein